jgi:hypothetical protein
MYARGHSHAERGVELPVGAAGFGLPHAQAVAGDKQKLNGSSGDGRRVGITPIVFALLYLDIGNKDLAFQWLDRGIAQRSMYMDELKVEPMFDRLHSDPRFPALLRKMRLEN